MHLLQFSQAAAKFHHSPGLGRLFSQVLDRLDQLWFLQTGDSRHVDYQVEAVPQLSLVRPVIQCGCRRHSFCGCVYLCVCFIFNNITTNNINNNTLKNITLNHLLFGMYSILRCLFTSLDLPFIDRRRLREELSLAATATKRAQARHWHITGVRLAVQIVRQWQKLVSCQ